VTDDLASLATAEREAQTVDNVVETRLQLLQQQFAGHAGLVRSLLVVGAELRLQREVDALGLLLLAQLQTVAHNLLHLARLAMLSRGEVALLNGALLGEALGSLEEKFRAVAAAEAADGSGITCHFSAPDSGDDRFTRLS
jgi:hypothetical protein